MPDPGIPWLTPGSEPWRVSPRAGEGLAPSSHKAAIPQNPHATQLAALLPPAGGRAVCGDTREKPRPGHDNLPERTGRALADCPRQGSRPFSERRERLTADQSPVPQTGPRLLNEAVSSCISMPRGNAYGVSPSPRRRAATGHRYAFGPGERLLWFSLPPCLMNCIRGGA